MCCTTNDQFVSLIVIVSSPSLYSRAKIVFVPVFGTKKQYSCVQTRFLKFVGAPKL